ncbi:MAG TPA: AAA family ATPase, partial [Acidimicrobiia bacterium]|nr:AAA family ATPase [Acidimicrobiia bacterium]
GNEKGLVVGDIVNTASRLQAAADPGTVLVGDATKRLTEAAIRYEPAGEQVLKGKADPVTAWRALGVVAERGGRGKWGVLEPPFAGRDGELRVIKEQLHATSREGTARLISIVGEAGIGKSRLSWELLKYLDGLTEVFRWHQGRSPAYGEGVTFWAVAEMVRSRAGIAETDETSKARTKLRTAVAEYITDAEEQGWIEPKLAGLLGLADMPSGDRNELFAALRTFFQRIAERDTTVLLFEDLQWADEGQLAFIEELVEMSSRQPIFVITLARPELLERHPTWGTSRHHFAAMHLGPLTDEEMRELVTGLTPGISGQLVDLVVRRAGGVPLYAVEYVRMLINTGDLVLEGSSYRQGRELTDVALPDSLHAVVGARLDRLDEQSRALVQDAAILGQSFTVEGLTVLTGSTTEELERKLRDLARRELLRYETDPRSPERGQYQFIQSVIREVAYGRIAKSDRKDRHLKVAEYFTSVAPIEAAAVIASHYMNAYEVAPDQELAEKARNALMKAARRAIELHSASQALSLLEQALEVPGTEEQQAALWQFAVRPAGDLFRHEDAIGYARKAYDWHLEHGSPADIATSARVVGTAYIDADQPLEAVAAMAPHFETEGASEPKMMALGAELARAHMRSWQTEDAGDVSLAVMIAAEAAGDMPTLIEAMNTRGTVLPDMGRANEGIALLREALRLAEMHGLPYPTLRALNNLLVVESINGMAALMDTAERGYELAQRIRHGGLLVRMAGSHSWDLFERGFIEEALAVLSEVEPGEESYWRDARETQVELYGWVKTSDPVHLARAREANRSGLDSPEPQYRSNAQSNESEFLWLEGRLEEVLELAPKVEAPLALHLFRHDAISAAIRLKDPKRLRDALELVKGEMGRRFELLRFAGATGLELMEGDPDQAAVMFIELCDRFEEVESPRMAAVWRAVFAEVMPDRPEAKAAAQEAFKWFSDVGAQGYLELFSPVWERQLEDTSLAV